MREILSFCILLFSFLSNFQTTHAIYVEAPSSFAARDDSNLIAYYPFLAEQCKRPYGTPLPSASPSTISSFEDVVPTTSLLGPLVTGNTSFDCLHTPAPSPATQVFELSRNGIKASGGKVNRIIQSTNTITNFKDAIITNAPTSEAQFTIEMWIRPDFGTEIPDTDENYLVLFEIGDPTAPGSYLCKTNFGFRFGLFRDTDGSHKFFGQMMGHATSFDCGSQGTSAVIPGGLVNGQLYHIIVNIYGTYVDPVRTDYMEVYLNPASSVSFGTTTNVNLFRVLGFLGDGRTLQNPVISGWKNTWIAHIATTPKISNSQNVAWKGDINHFAIYKGKMTTTQMASLFNAKMVNTAPSVISFDGTTKGRANITAPEDATTNIDLTLAAYDYDRDGFPHPGTYSTSGLTYELLGPPKAANINKGTLVDGSGLDITVFPVNLTNPTSLKYLSPLNEPATTGSHIQFQFRVYDQVLPSLTTGTVTVVITETNDAPTAVAPTGVQSVIEDEIKIFLLSGKDIDVTSSLYGVRGVNITGQGDPRFGKLYVYNGTACTNTTIKLPYQIQFGGNPPSQYNEPAEADRARFCYRASVGLGDSSKTVIGYDNITFVAYDVTNTFSASVTFPIEIRNALLAGCSQPTNNNPCVFQRCEGVNGVKSFELQGYDSINRPYTDRRYIITSLPANGTLYEWEFGDEKGPQIQVGTAYSADATTGNFKFIFEPKDYFYNQYCHDVDGVSTGACADNSAVIRSYDLRGVPINNCADPVNGCPITFNYKLRISSDNSESPENTAQIWVTNVNNFAYNITAPSLVDQMKANTRYIVSDSGPFYIQDYDGDVRVLGVLVKVAGTGTSVAAKDIPTELLTQSRIRMIEGETCFQTGNCPGNILFKAPISDANLFLDSLEVTTTKSSGSTKLNVKVWDNANDIQDDEFPWSISSSPQATIEVTLNFGVPTPPTPPNTLTTTLIYVGIGFGALVVVASCAGCITSICIRARRGERTAMWIVSNILCSHVGEAPDGDDARMSIKRRQSIESAVSGAETNFRAAIRAEHARMRNVVICANFFAIVFPCCCKKYKERVKRASVPSLQEMVEVAVMVEREKIALGHVPEGKPQDLDGDGIADEVKKPSKMAQVAKEKMLMTKAEIELAKANAELAGEEAAAVAREKDDGDDEIEIDRVADDSIFDWEKHIDPKSGRPYYYNPKTNKSSWEPPKVKIRRKSLDKAQSVGVSKETVTKRFEPKPPTKPKEHGEESAVAKE